MKEKKLIYGIGINDADYNVSIKQTYICQTTGKKIRKLVWICPYYLRWLSMFKRCYSHHYHLKHPSYKECEVFDSWHKFTNFRAWMEKQDWIDKQLDKDLLFPGNKVYGPDTCVFIDQKLNNFLLERANGRGEHPIGVHYDKTTFKYIAQCADFESSKRKRLGSFDSPNEAHKAWLTEKLRQARLLAQIQEDPRVSKALLERYENYAGE